MNDMKDPHQQGSELDSTGGLRRDSAQDESLVRAAQFVNSQIPKDGLFAGLEWRLAPQPYALSPKHAQEIDRMGRVLTKFYEAVNLLYRQSYEGKQPAWVSDWLDRGKPSEVVEAQRSEKWRSAIPRVIRPDILVTEQGLSIVELDSVPGGMGVTAFFNQLYSRPEIGNSVLGGADGMLKGFASIFGQAKDVFIVVSEEAATYRPEMEWICAQLNQSTAEKSYTVVDSSRTDFPQGAAIYRFFELFDQKNVASFSAIKDAALQGEVTITPPLKPVFEEKMLFALLWEKSLNEFWRQNLGDAFFKQMKQWVPQTWLVTPVAQGPQVSIAGLDISDWGQLKNLSQRDRNFVLKLSGYSPEAWGSRSVSIGPDLSREEWAVAVDKAIASAESTPYVLMRYQKPSIVPMEYFDAQTESIKREEGRARLCPYYFVESGPQGQLRSALGGLLATICPADAKIIHGRADAVLTTASV